MQKANKISQQGRLAEGNAHEVLQAPKRGAYAVLGLQEPWKNDSAWACVESGQVLFNKCGNSPLNASLPLSTE